MPDVPLPYLVTEHFDWIWTSHGPILLMFGLEVGEKSRDIESWKSLERCQTPNAFVASTGWNLVTGEHAWNGL